MSTEEEQREEERTDGSPTRPVSRRAKPASSAPVAAAIAENVKKETVLPREWVMLLQLVAVIAGALLLVAGSSKWDEAPPPQIGKVTVDGNETIVMKTTTTTSEDQTKTVVEEPAVAAPGRSETVVIVLLGLGALLIVAGALPGRTLTLKGPGFEGTLGAVGAAAADDIEKTLQAEGVDPQTVEEAAAKADRLARANFLANFEELKQGTLRRVAGDLTGGRLGPSSTKVIATAAENAIDDACRVALSEVPRTP